MIHLLLVLLHTLFIKKNFRDIFFWLYVLLFTANIGSCIIFYDKLDWTIGIKIIHATIFFIILLLTRHYIKVKSVAKVKV